MKTELIIFWKRLSHLCTKSHLCTVLFFHLCTEISHLCTVYHLCTNLYIDEILYIDDNLYIDETIPKRVIDGVPTLAMRRKYIKTCWSKRFIKILYQKIYRSMDNFQTNKTSDSTIIRFYDWKYVSLDASQKNDSDVLFLFRV